MAKATFQNKDNTEIQVFLTTMDRNPTDNTFAIQIDFLVMISHWCSETGQVSCKPVVFLLERRS